MRHFLIATFGCVLIFFAECRNDLDLLADYKPVIVCYALLDPYESVHYVRISRAFLGEGNALVMAQTQDSISFPPGTLNVRIEQWKDGQLIQAHTLQPDTTIPREEGIFVSPYQVIYSGAFAVQTDGSIYRLIVTDLVKGTTVHSETEIVGHTGMISPNNPLAPLNLWDTTLIMFRSNSGVNASRYAFKIRFHYTEQFIADTTQTAERFVDWEVGTVDLLSDAGNQVVQVSTQRSNFLRMAAQQIPYNPDVRRIAGKIDLIYVGAAMELVTYITVGIANNTSPNGIEPYSNITDGFGLFSARTTTSFPGYLLDQDTHDELRLNPVTQDLNFVR